MALKRDSNQADVITLHINVNIQYTPETQRKAETSPRREPMSPAAVDTATINEGTFYILQFSSHLSEGSRVL